MYKKLFFPLLVLFGFQFAYSQNQSNSPYTRFGYGEIADSKPTELKGMGGVSMAHRSKNTINGFNPASYSSVDSMRFMFDIGGKARLSKFKTLSDSHNTFNANLDYITLRFPVGKWIAFGAGLEPYSFSGYNFMQTDSTKMPNIKGANSDNILYAKTFSGSGGFSQIYGGLSVNILDYIALGVNGYYMFGEINNVRTLAFSNRKYTPTVYNNSMIANDFRLRYGVQVFHTFNKKHEITLGGIFEPKHQLNGKFRSVLNSKEAILSKGFELPQTIGSGISYVFDEKLRLGADYMRKDWKNTNFFGKIDTLVTTNHIAVGAEYTPNPRSRKYADHIRYRLGFSTANQYYKVNNRRANQNYNFTFGIGIPTLTGKSIMNFAFEYGNIGGGILKESYLKLSFSATINENWFFKPKI